MDKTFTIYQQSLCENYDRMIASLCGRLKCLSLDEKLEITAKYSGITYENLVFKTFKDVRIIVGSSNPSLGDRIALELGITKTSCMMDFFADKSPNVKIHKNMRKKHVFILQTGASNEKYSINDFSEQLLATIDACKRSAAKSITAIIPNFPNARSDKRDAPRVPIMAKETIKKFEKGVKVVKPYLRYTPQPNR